MNINAHRNINILELHIHLIYSLCAVPHTALILVLLTTVIPPLQEADANYRRKYHQYGCG